MQKYRGVGGDKNGQGIKKSLAPLIKIGMRMAVLKGERSTLKYKPKPLRGEKDETKQAI